jgi:hypothetical protein
MAHYAYIDEDNIVTQVIVGPDEDGETDWEAYFSAKGKGRAVRTSYNTMAGVHLNGGEPFRFNYAGIGYTYDEERDAFIPPKPYDSWVLNEGTCLFEAPIPMPEDGGVYDWNEESQSWDLVVSES